MCWLRRAHTLFVFFCALWIKNQRGDNMKTNEISVLVHQTLQNKKEVFELQVKAQNATFNISEKILAEADNCRLNADEIVSIIKSNHLLLSRDQNYAAITFVKFEDDFKLIFKKIAPDTFYAMGISRHYKDDPRVRSEEKTYVRFNVMMSEKELTELYASNISPQEFFELIRLIFTERYFDSEYVELSLLTDRLYRLNIGILEHGNIQIIEFRDVLKEKEERKNMPTIREYHNARKKEEQEKK
ncbi:hypothetical protein CULT_1880006 [[Clostridium] ultunense Esp]|nr:hypothetical protein CULT_1880006 [[Clostridium] ultunense Esp]